MLEVNLLTADVVSLAITFTVVALSDRRVMSTVGRF